MSRRSRRRDGTPRNAQARSTKIGRLTDAVQGPASIALQKLLEHEGNGDSPRSTRKYFRDKVIPAMAALREAGDALECIVPHDLWPLPTYREMLFVR